MPLLWVTWGWDNTIRRNHQQTLTVQTLLHHGRLQELPPLGPFRIEGLWHLSSPNSGFLGWSAMTIRPSGAFMAFSDRNMRLRFMPPGYDGRYAPGLHRIVIRRAIFSRLPGGAFAQFDIESVQADPDGSLWFGLEADARLIRISPDRRHGTFVAVPEMNDWPENGGAEAMTRTPDGRWVILCESCDTGRDGHHPGLLFDKAPDQARARSFDIVLPRGFDPVDMTTLPDGRLLILTRRLAWLLPHFESGLVLADLSALRPGQPLETRELARIVTRELRENYEAMVVQSDAHGPAVWLLSDDNGMALQQTRLLKLRLDLAALPPVH